MAAFKMGNPSALRLDSRLKELAVRPEDNGSRNSLTISVVGSTVDCPTPRKRSLSGRIVSPFSETMVALASRASKAIEVSAAGRAFTTLPPTVPALRTCVDPTQAAASARAAAAAWIRGDPAIWVCVLKAPIRSHPSVFLISFNSVNLLISTKALT